MCAFYPEQVDEHDQEKQGQMEYGFQQPGVHQVAGNGDNQKDNESSE